METSSKPFNVHVSVRVDVTVAGLVRTQDLYYLPLRKKYRGHFEIMALMLEAAKQQQASRFTIMSHAKINCGQLKKYLGSVSEMGFLDVRVASGRVFYLTNDKGLDFLKQYYTLLSLLCKTAPPDKFASMAYEAQPLINRSQL